MLGLRQQLQPESYSTQCQFFQQSPHFGQPLSQQSTVTVAWTTPELKMRATICPGQLLVEETTQLLVVQLSFRKSCAHSCLGQEGFESVMEQLVLDYCVLLRKVARATGGPG